MITRSSSNVPKVQERKRKIGQVHQAREQKSQVITKRKDFSVHKTLFKPGVLKDGIALAYHAGGKVVKRGRRQGLGILCNCCKKEMSYTQFERHCGYGQRRNPYYSIFLPNGQSLHHYALCIISQRSTHTKAQLSKDNNDNVCVVCGEGGTLVLCDSCTSSFHHGCMGSSQFINKVKKYCPNCEHHNHFGSRIGKKTQISRRIGGLVAKNKCSRNSCVVKEAEKTYDGCVICRCNSIQRFKFEDKTIIICDQCEREFHISCLRESGIDDLKNIPKEEWFCNKECEKLFSELQRLALHGPSTIPKDLLKKTTDKNMEQESGSCINWQIIHGQTKDRKKIQLLSKVVSIFHECFAPIRSPDSERDLIDDMVHSRSIKNEDHYGGMYCALLTVNSEVVSAAVFRILGRRVAEIPLVATKSLSQRQGHFRMLFSCMESLFLSLKVENIVLPATGETKNLWINKMSFRKIPEKQLFERYTNELPITCFEANFMLEKRCSKL